jgi:hypothetical protein
VNTPIHGLPPHLADLADSGVMSSARLAATLLRYEYDGGEEMLARKASRGHYGVPRRSLPCTAPRCTASPT